MNYYTSSFFTTQSEKNVYVKDNVYYLEIPMIGYNVDDVNISYEPHKRVLTITGNSDESPKGQRCNFKYGGKYEKQFTLDGTAFDVDNFEPTLKNGVLTIKMPLDKKSHKKTIKVTKG